jgi:Arabinose efflux permease
MGLGFGGEWAAGAVLIGEVIRAEHRGKAVGAMQSGWAIGWGIAALLATVFFTIFPQEIAWRVLFWVGLTPALLIFFLRRFVDEPPSSPRRGKIWQRPARGSTFWKSFLPRF